MNRLLNQLGSKYTADMFGDLFDRVGINNIAIDHNEFVKVGKPDAAGLAEDSPRRIFINTRVTGFAKVTAFELLHHAAGGGMYSDRQLDKAVISLMTPEKQAQARSQMKGTKGKPYQPSTIAHRELNDNCFSKVK